MKSEIKTPTTNNTGLCGNCGDQDDCGLVRSSSGPRMFCEEYWVPGPGHDRKPASLLAAENASDRAAGLCLNCLNRNDCKLPRGEGGVWYCEEYE